MTSDGAYFPPARAAQYKVKGEIPHNVEIHGPCWSALKAPLVPTIENQPQLTVRKPPQSE